MKNGVVEIGNISVEPNCKSLPPNFRVWEIYAEENLCPQLAVNAA